MTDERDPVAAVRAVGVALDAVAHALAHARLDDLLAAEAVLATAVSRLPLESISATVGGNLQRELVRTRRALVRCRRLGAALGETARMSLAARGAAGSAYDRGGQARAPSAARALEARV